MQIFIHIECKTDEEALAHLHEIRNKIMKQMLADPEAVEKIEFEHTNVIGTHEIEITER